MPDARPNIVVFFSDQQRFDSTGVGGNPLDLTPNFDRLARSGTFVKHGFTPQPVCGPARSCLQTGLYATQTGVFRNGIALNPNLPSIAPMLAEAGYRNAYVGKWHLGGHNSAGPVDAKYRQGYHHWRAANAIEHTSDAYQTRVWDEHDRPIDLHGYRVDALADEGIRFMVDHRARSSGQAIDQPFFLMMSFLEPHHQNHRDDYPAPDGYAERYTGRFTPPDLQALGGTSSRHLPGYWGMVKRLDEALGRVVDAMKSLGILENTVILYISDHGNHFKTRNSEYKRSAHDASIRVPMMLSGGAFAGGGELSEMVSLVDVVPTLLDVAGVAVPSTMVGRSILPLVQRNAGVKAGWPTEVLVQISESQVGRAIRTVRWKYAVTAPHQDAWRDAGSDRYVESELYDLHADPYELENLIEYEVYEPLKIRLRERLAARMRQAGEAEPTIEAKPGKPSGQRHLLPDEIDA